MPAVGSWTVGQLDSWTVGQLDSWQLDSWPVGSWTIGSWTVGNWAVGQLAVGQLDRLKKYFLMTGYILAKNVINHKNHLLWREITKIWLYIRKHSIWLW
jgi:hypothetical protein